MARRNEKSRRQDEDIGAKILRGVLAGCAMAAVLVFGIFFFIGVIIAIRFNEARRHGGGPFAPPPKTKIDPPPVEPPPIDPRPIDPRPIDPPPIFNPVNVGKDGYTRTNIVGGGGDPQFEDTAPAGGMLIGLELAIVNNDAIKSVRPIYSLEGKEVKGAQVGTEKLNVVIKAKQGYAVSAMNVNAGLWLDGMSLTFARVNKGKLDVNDTYPSPYYGGPGGGRSIHGGQGMLVVGVIGKRAPDNSANGIGLLLK